MRFGGTPSHANRGALPAATVARLAEERTAAELAPLTGLTPDDMPPFEGEEDLLREIDEAERRTRVGVRRCDARTST